MHNQQVATVPLAVNAHVEALGRVSGQSSITTYEFLGFLVSSDRWSKQMGTIEDPLINPNDSFWSSAAYQTRQRLINPADRQAAISAAYYDAIENSGADYLVETRAKIETTGYSFFGLFGWGKAVGTVSGVGMTITKGDFRHSVEIRNIENGK